MALQFGNGADGDQGLLANGRRGHDIAPALALWNRMMPDNGRAGRLAT